MQKTYSDLRTTIEQLSGRVKYRSEHRSDREDVLEQCAILEWAIREFESHPNPEPLEDDPQMVAKAKAIISAVRAG